MLFPYENPGGSYAVLLFYLAGSIAAQTPKVHKRGIPFPALLTGVHQVAFTRRVTEILLQHILGIDQLFEKEMQGGR